jgi:hypothetical protein
MPRESYDVNFEPLVLQGTPRQKIYTCQFQFTTSTVLHVLSPEMKNNYFIEVDASCINSFMHILCEAKIKVLVGRKLPLGVNNLSTHVEKK